MLVGRPPGTMEFRGGRTAGGRPRMGHAASLSLERRGRASGYRLDLGSAGGNQSCGARSGVSVTGPSKPEGVSGQPEASKGW